MRRLSLGLGLSILLAMPGLVAAQSFPPPSPGRQFYEPVPNDPAGSFNPKAKLPKLKPMYEDIEILRRILNRDFAKRHQQRQCASCHQDVRTSAAQALRALAFSPDGKMLATEVDRKIIRLWDVTSGKENLDHNFVVHPFTGAEGTYLGGVGVVYTITLPPLAEDVHAPPARPAAPPLSDWDRVHKHLLGEKVEAPPAPERKQASLSDTVLKALADNGRHFKQLGPNESLTVVITFRRNDSTSLRAEKLAGMSPEQGLPGPGTGGAPVKSYPDPLAPPASVPGIGTPPANPSTATDYELLADLQLKQGRVAEAIAGYKRAVDRNPGSKELVSLYRKLAQAYLMREEDVYARDAIERAMKYLKAMQKEPAPRVQATGMAAALPSQQLIISVPKSLLDQVAAGQISFQQFSDAAHVELRTFGETTPQVRP